MDTLHQYQQLRELLLTEFQEEIERIHPLLTTGVNLIGNDHVLLKIDDHTRFSAIKNIRRRFAVDVGTALHGLVAAYANELGREAARLGLNAGASAPADASEREATSPAPPSEPKHSERTAAQYASLAADALKSIVGANEAPESQRRRLRYGADSKHNSAAQARVHAPQRDDDDLLVAPAGK